MSSRILSESDPRVSLNEGGDEHDSTPQIIALQLKNNTNISPLPKVEQLTSSTVINQSLSDITPTTCEEGNDGETKLHENGINQASNLQDESQPRDQNSFSGNDHITIFLKDKLETHSPNEAGVEEPTVQIDTNRLDSPTAIVSKDHDPAQEKAHGATHLGNYLYTFLNNAKIVLIAIIPYCITSYCAATASVRHSPLALVSPSHGVLLLNVLSKSSDIGLGCAVSAMWESLQWASIARGLDTPLVKFLALSESTSSLGLFKILDPRTSAGTSARFWSFARLLALVLVPGPGTILMADVNPVDLYFPLQWTNISGGVGLFDASLTDDFTTMPGPYLAGLLQYLLQNPEITFEVASVNNQCDNSQADCNSYLISGGIRNVSPWQDAIGPTDALNYIIKDGPAYQIDFEETSTYSWPSSRCRLYYTQDLAIQVCIDRDENTKEITAGWRSCSMTILSLGLCDQPWSENGTFGWQTTMAVYRRKATITASRTSWKLLDIQDLSTPSIQDINPNDLFTILDIILSPAQNSTVNQNSSSYGLSNYLFQFLHLSSKPNAQISKQPLHYLRNLLTIPLYLCNPVTFTNSTSITTPQTDLPAENQLLGTNAINATRAVPGSWTVWTYIATAGSIVLLCLVVIGVNSRTETRETSSFPFADFLMSTTVHGTNRDEDGGGTAGDVKYDDLFDEVKKPGDNEGILRHACDVKIYLKT